LSPSDSFKLSLGNFSIAFAGTVSSWFTQTRFGRRQIYMTGLAAVIPLMWRVGFLEFPPALSGSTTKWTQFALLLIWFFCYGVSIGPIPYAIASEAGSSQLRVKTISLGRNMYYFLSVINVACAPYTLNPKGGNLKGKAASPPPAAFTVLLLIWAYFRLPETKGLTPE
jgi:SP family general alpha glucoside:H+ symporter-like MFS transporter